MRREPMLRGWFVVTAGVLATAGAGAGSRATAFQDPPAIRSSATPCDPKELGVGRYVTDAAGRDGEGREVSWRAGRGDKLTVVALGSVTCPLSRKFAPALARTEASYADRGVRFVHVNVSGIDTPEEMRRHAQEHGSCGLNLLDDRGALACAFEARTTTEVFVVDSANTLVYRGAVSDQYGLGFALEAPRRRFLEAALDALLSGREPEVRATHSPGCALEPPDAADDAAEDAAEDAPTYAREIARILRENCVDCHRAGGVAPFGLEGFESVSRRAAMIETVVRDGAMPPWFAAPAHDGARRASPWANDRSLDPTEKRVLSAWIAAGKPRGDDAELPLPRSFGAGEWTIGRPDAVYALPEKIAIKAEGVMPYQHVMVATDLEQDQWVTAAQIAPTDKSVVHHVLVFALPEAALHDAQLRRGAASDGTRGYFAAYVPGNEAVAYPEGLAKRLPRKSALLFQIHYTPTGKATSDQLKLGLVFAREAPRRVVRTAGLANQGLRIPPHAARHAEVAEAPVLPGARILAFLPHMHVRGAAFRYELVPSSGGESVVLLDVPRYDFNWQLRYELREPYVPPPGSTLRATAWYDNSARNPANPDPTTTVRWGPQTYDEMMLGYVEYYLEDEHPARPTDGRAADPPRSRGAPSFERLLARFDANGDGKVGRSEVPASLHAEFERLDRNRDGELTADDF